MHPLKIQSPTHTTTTPFSMHTIHSHRPHNIFFFTPPFSLSPPPSTPYMGRQKFIYANKRCSSLKTMTKFIVDLCQAPEYFVPGPNYIHYPSILLIFVFHIYFSMPFSPSITVPMHMSCCQDPLMIHP